MKSNALPSFWKAYEALDEKIKKRARKTYELFSENLSPFPSFQMYNAEESIWSVRVTLGYRAIGIMEKDTVTWFWIGDHDSYEKYFG
jgi:hypothetical protein